MTWFYKEGGQAFGPVSKAQLQELIKTKQISGKTLIRSAPTDPWRPLSEMVKPKQPGPADSADSAQVPPQAPPPPPSGPTDADGQGGGAAAAQVPATVVCSQCGRSFPDDQVVRFDGKIICAACKPIFVQRMKEGVAAPGIHQFAGFWIRFGAKVIDWIVVGVTQYIIMIPLGMFMFSSLSTAPETPEQLFTSGWLALMGVQQLISIAIPAAYNTYFIGRFGATLGKMACRLKVVTPEGDKVSYTRALGRNFAEWLSALILLIGYIMAAFDNEKRALHDRICSTRVVHK